MLFITLLKLAKRNAFLLSHRSLLIIALSFPKAITINVYYQHRLNSIFTSLIS